MRSVDRRRELALIILFFGPLTVARAEVLSSHPYVDRHSARAAELPSPGPTSCNCRSSVAHGGDRQVEQRLESGDGHRCGGGCRGSHSCPPVTNALLRVWVSDEATVYVNGVKTKPQHLAGVHQGCRVFSLTNLQPDLLYSTTVRVVGTKGQQTKRVSIQAGETKDVHLIDFSPMQFVLGEQFGHQEAIICGDNRKATDVIFNPAITRSILRFQETTKALAELPDFHVQLKYHLALHRGEAGGQPRFETFAIIEQSVDFKRGEAIVPFYDRTRPDEHLSATFRRHLLQKNPLETSGNSFLIRVQITATLPDGTETNVGYADDPLMISVKWPKSK